MKVELKIIKKYQTWELVDRPKHKKVIRVKWVYRTNLNLDGSVKKKRGKARCQGIYTNIWGRFFNQLMKNPSFAIFINT
jgi:hypothetical protein